MINRRNLRYRKESKIKDVIYKHIENNIKQYTIVCILFIIGIIIGVIFINNMSEVGGEEIREYLTSFITSLKDNREINNFELLKESVGKNLGLALLIWFMGSTVIGVSVVYLTVCFRGFVLGYTIASSISFLGIGKGLLFIATSLLIQTILFIPCILALSVSGIKLYNSIMKDRRKENIRIEVLRHTLFCAIIAIFLILCSLIEVYISKNFLILCIEYL